jgi:hypothetical protein
VSGIGDEMVFGGGFMVGESGSEFTSLYFLYLGGRDG